MRFLNVVVMPQANPGGALDGSFFLKKVNKLSL
jgi:hypothetical protein